MPMPSRPSLDQMVEYLRGVGFTKVGTYENSTACIHPAVEGAVLLFLNGPPDQPVREIEFRMTRRYLTERGFVSEEDFDRFAAAAVPGRSAPEPAAQPAG